MRREVGCQRQRSGPPHRGSARPLTTPPLPSSLWSSRPCWAPATAPGAFGTHGSCGPIHGCETPLGGWPSQACGAATHGSLLLRRIDCRSDRMCWSRRPPQGVDGKYGWGRLRKQTAPDLFLIWSYSGKSIRSGCKQVAPGRPLATRPAQPLTDR